MKLIKKPTIVVGTGIILYHDFLKDNDNVQFNELSEKNQAKAESMFSILEIEDIHPSFDFDFNSKLEPYYIRKSQAEVNRSKN
jgi:hypothetical protein